MSRIVLTIKSLNISSIIRSSVGRSKMNSFGCFDLDVDNEWNSSVEVEVFEFAEYREGLLETRGVTG